MKIKFYFNAGFIITLVILISIVLCSHPEEIAPYIEMSAHNDTHFSIFINQTICNLPPFFGKECMDLDEIFLFLKEHDENMHLKRQVLFEILPHSLICAEGVNLKLVLDNQIIPCVKCHGGGDVATDGYHLYCENKGTDHYCRDQPTYFAMMLGDFPLCVRRSWWYGTNPLYGYNAGDINRYYGKDH